MDQTMKPVRECEGLAGVDRDYNLLMSAMQVSVSKHLLDDSFTMVWGNDFYYKLIRYSKEEYESLFHNRPDLYYPYHHYEAELKTIGAAVKEAVQNGCSSYSIITRMPVKGGGHIWVRMNGIFTEEFENDLRISYTVITDITDLVEMKQTQSITYHNIPGFVAKFLIKDYTHITLLDANERFFSFFGNDVSRTSSNPLFQKNVDMNRDKILAQLENVKEGKHVRFLAKLQNREGRVLWMQANGDCVDWIDGFPVYQILYIDVTDMTELQEMQKKLEIQAQQLKDALAGAQKANEAKRVFLSRISHEIRTPMNAIIGMTTIAKAHLNDRDRIQDCLQKIEFSSKHLLSLINDILDMSKIEDGKLITNQEPFYMQQILESIMAIIYPQAAAKKITFKISVQDFIEEELMGDAMRVSQILLNLLSNALKFTPENGRVRLEVRQMPYEKDAVMMRFAVSDTGQGMSEEFLNRLYQPFVQESAAVASVYGGTGLGLAITKNLVALLNGTISVQSRLHEGTVFIVELPFARMKKQETTPYHSMAALKVLVCEEDPDDGTYTSMLLGKFGIHSKHVKSGEEAIKEICHAHHVGETYDICLLSWNIEDMNVAEVIRNIRSEMGQDMLVVIVTAYDFGMVEKKVQAAGADLFLAKPFFASSLYDILLTAICPEERHDWNLQASEQGKTYGLSGKRLLLVEDNALNREIAVELLKMAGAEISCVKDGEEALNWFLAETGRNCDGILMDIQMPIMNGYQATRAIRASGCANAENIPIVAMTADAFREDAAAVLEAGMNAHIAKPIDMEVLYQTLQNVLNTD